MDYLFQYLIIEMQLCFVFSLDLSLKHVKHIIYCVAVKRFCFIFLVTPLVRDFSFDSVIADLNFILKLRKHNVSCRLQRGLLLTSKIDLNCIRSIKVQKVLLHQQAFAFPPVTIIYTQQGPQMTPYQTPVMQQLTASSYHFSLHSHKLYSKFWREKFIMSIC